MSRSNSTSSIDSDSSAEELIKLLSQAKTNDEFLSSHFI